MSCLRLNNYASFYQSCFAQRIKQTVCIIGVNTTIANNKVDVTITDVTYSFEFLMYRIQATETSNEDSITKRIKFQPNELSLSHTTNRFLCILLGNMTTIMSHATQASGQKTARNTNKPMFCIGESDQYPRALKFSDSGSVAFSVKILSVSKFVGTRLKVAKLMNVVVKLITF